MISSTVNKLNKFIQITVMAVVMGLGMGAPATAQSITMSCGNVSSMETAISNSICCNSDPSDDPAQGCEARVGTAQCALAEGTLQNCCADPSETETTQNACLCAAVSPYASNQGNPTIRRLGFIPSGC